MNRLSFLQDESNSFLQSGDQLNNGVNVLDATELYTLKWLKWQILCYVYFTTILKVCMPYYYTPQ